MINISLKTYSLTEYWDIGSYLAHLIYNYYSKLSFDCLLTTSVCCYDRKKITLLFKPPLIRLQKPQFKHYFRVPVLLCLLQKNWLRNVKLCPWKLVFKFTSVGYCVVPTLTLIYLWEFYYKYFPNNIKIVGFSTLKGVLHCYPERSILKRIDCAHGNY